jgi:hypothetical protein
MIIICGGLINYLINSEKKSRLDPVLRCCNLASIVDFPTRIQTKPGTVINCIFIDTLKINYTISSLIKGLSDHNSTSYDKKTYPNAKLFYS